MQILNDKWKDEPVTVTLPAEQLMQMIIHSVHEPEVTAETFSIVREAIFKKLGVKS